MISTSRPREREWAAGCHGLPPFRLSAGGRPSSYEPPSKVHSRDSRNAWYNPLALSLPGYAGASGLRPRLAALASRRSMAGGCSCPRVPRARKGTLAARVELTPTWVTAGIRENLSVPFGFRTIAGLWWPIRRALGYPSSEDPRRDVQRIAVGIGVNKASAAPPPRTARSAAEKPMKSCGVVSRRTAPREFDALGGPPPPTRVGGRRGALAGNSC